MQGGEEPSGAERAIVYCVVPRELVSKLHPLLRRHFASDAGVEVIAERRSNERRGRIERRATEAERGAERRLILALSGRRVADRRSPARIQAGDRELFGTLYMRYLDRVYGYLLVVLNNRDEAEDATQQVFTKALEALPRPAAHLPPAAASSPTRAGSSSAIRPRSRIPVGRVQCTHREPPACSTTSVAISSDPGSEALPG